MDTLAFPPASPDGLLLIDKPSDWTSHDVVNFVRRRFNVKKAGHCGTLDPFATGLLMVLVGKATKAQDTLMAESKVYSGVIRLGVETDSQDRTGQVTATHPLPEGLALAALQRAADSFLGPQSQIPPMVSAIKLHGQPLYKLARKGQTVEREPRAITIDSFTLENLRDGEVSFLVHCSKGTYIRTLCHDIGRSLGCGGCMSALRRTEAGGFSVEDAVMVAEVQRLRDEGRLEERLLPVDTLFSHLGSVGQSCLSILPTG